jgi:hypothetical protein
LGALLLTPARATALAMRSQFVVFGATFVLGAILAAPVVSRGNVLVYVPYPPPPPTLWKRIPVSACVPASPADAQAMKYHGAVNSPPAATWAYLECPFVPDSTFEDTSVAHIEVDTYMGQGVNTIAPGASAEACSVTIDEGFASCGAQANGSLATGTVGHVGLNVSPSAWTSDATHDRYDWVYVGLYAAPGFGTVSSLLGVTVTN